MPGTVGDGAQGEAHLGEIVLRAGDPVARAGVFALQREAGEAHARRVDPVVVLRVLVDVPGVRPVPVHAVRLDPQPGRDGRPVRGGQDGIEQVIGAGDSDQESADVQVGPAEVRDLAEPPVAPAQVSLEAQLRLRCVLRVSGQLVAEGPGAHVLPEEARVVVIGGLGRGVVHVQIEDGGEVRGDLLVRPGGGGAKGGDVPRAEKQVRVGSAQEEREGDRC